MPRGPSVTPRVKGLIAKVYYEHTDWAAKEVQKEVSTLIIKADPKSKPDWPGLSVVQKELQTLRKSPNPKDNPWNVLTLSEYIITGDALPVVLQAWVHSTLNTSRALTIREAKWVEQLYRVVTDIDQLTRMARKYAFWEFIDERYGARFVYPTNDHKLYEIATGLKLSDEQRRKLLDKRLLDMETMLKNTWRPNKGDQLKLPVGVFDQDFLDDFGFGKWWEVSP